VHGLVPRSYRLLGDQLRRLASDEEPINVVTGAY